MASQNNGPGRGSRAGDGKIALVTGGSKGIGLAIAHALAAAGASVVITGRDQAALDRAVKSAAEGTNVRGVRADVQNHEDAARAVAEAVTAFGGLDILVNNAGVGGVGERRRHVGRRLGPDDRNQSEWSVLLLPRGPSRSCAGEAAGGSSASAALPARTRSPAARRTAPSKAGLNAFSEALMQEVRYDNIRVSCIMPGSVATGFGGREVGADWKLAPEDVAEVVIDLLEHPARSLPSRVELRPSRPRK